MGRRNLFKEMQKEEPTRKAMGIGREVSRKTADSGYDHQRSRMLFRKVKKINSSEGNTATPEGDY